MSPAELHSLQGRLPDSSDTLSLFPLWVVFAKWCPLAVIKLTLGVWCIIGFTCTSLGARWSFSRAWAESIGLDYCVLTTQKQYFFHLSVSTSVGCLALCKATRTCRVQHIRITLHQSFRAEETALYTIIFSLFPTCFHHWSRIQVRHGPYVQICVALGGLFLRLPAR